MLTYINTSYIEANCVNPSFITTSLTDVTNMMLRQFTTQEVGFGRYSRSETFQYPLESRRTALEAFKLVCSDMIYNQRCTSDTQCLSGHCDKASSQVDQRYYRMLQRPIVLRTVRATWGAYDTMLDLANAKRTALSVEAAVVSFRIKRTSSHVRRNVSANGTVDKSEYDTLAEVARSNFTYIDCVGPQSDGARSRLAISFDNTTGLSTLRRISANETLCLTPKRCTFEDYLNPNETACSQTAISEPYFCGACNGAFCTSVTVSPRCYTSNYFTEHDCTAAGGVYTADLPGYGPYCAYPNNTRATCLSEAPCRNSDTSHACFAAVCYSPNITTQAACELTSGGYWNARSGTCHYDLAQAACVSAGLNYWPGRIHVAGRFATNASCSQGLCDIPSLIGASSVGCSI